MQYLLICFYIQVTPTGRHALTYDEESWKPTPEDLPKPEEITRSSETRTSTTKRVKKYLKKCKSVLISGTSDASSEEAPTTSSWYLDDLIHESEVHELEDIYEDAQVGNIVTNNDFYQVANVVDVKKSQNDIAIDIANSSPTLTDEQGKVDGNEGGVNNAEGEKPQTMVSGLIGLGVMLCLGLTLYVT